MQNKIYDFLTSHGAGQVGFGAAQENPFSLGFVISYTIPLSNSVVDGIDNAPTHTYFHHYRSINALIDHLSLRVGLMLAQNGYNYVAVPASQSVNGMQGIYSHKRAAVDSGLGTIGKSSLFISNKNGPRVRLGTILTDYPFKISPNRAESKCGNCRICTNACPAMAIKGHEWTPDSAREDIIDAKACSDYMKRAFQHIGRGAVCGICMRVCPYGIKNTDKSL